MVRRDRFLVAIIPPRLEFLPPDLPAMGRESEGVHPKARPRARVHGNGQVHNMGLAPVLRVAGESCPASGQVGHPAARMYVVTLCRLCWHQLYGGRRGSRDRGSGRRARAVGSRDRKGEVTNNSRGRV